MVKLKTTLFYRKDRSDKVYEVQMRREGTDYFVDVSWGRRGTTLQSQTKTPQPVTLKDALALFDRLVNEKKSDGYGEEDPGEAPAEASAPVKGRPARSGSAKAARPSKGIDLSTVLREIQSQWNSKLKWFNGTTTGVSLTCAATGDEGIVEHSWACVADPTFGVIRCDDESTWETRLAIPGFGDSVRININVPNASEGPDRDDESIVPEPPTEAQRNAFRALLDSPARYRQVVEDINWAYYTQYRTEQVDEDDEESRELLPNIQKPGGVWRLLSQLTIDVPVQPAKGTWIAFNWECRWDPEHGHKVVLKNGKENYVGTQAGG